MALVKNIIGYNGNEVVNQFVINVYGKKYFQSYQSIIACVNEDGSIELSNNWDYSRTTSKYLYKFLKDETPLVVGSRREMQKLIDGGSVKVTLNPDMTLVA